jgi:hypothetical protein
MAPAPWAGWRRSPSRRQPQPSPGLTGLAEGSQGPWRLGIAVPGTYACEGIAPQCRDSPVTARSAVICIMLPRIVALSATRAVASGA